MNTDLANDASKSANQHNSAFRHTHAYRAEVTGHAVLAR